MAEEPFDGDEAQVAAAAEHQERLARLVGVADGATGDDALALAERCARSAGFHLDLCTVVTPVPTFGHDSAVEATYAARDEAAMTTLRALRDRLGDDIVAEIHLCHDDSPARGLATMAQHLEASAVVIGGEPASGGAASALLHASPFPIILAADVVYDEEHPDDGGVNAEIVGQTTANSGNHAVTARAGQSSVIHTSL